MSISHGGRTVITVLSSVSVIVGAAACGTSNEADTADTAGREDSVVIEHRFGTTEIATAPERVVTIDLPWTDTILAMGAEPVGHTVDSFMPDSGVPWQLLSEESTPLSLDDGVPIEQIADLHPDLIVGTYSIADEATYELLSEIAPTIPALDENEVTAWQDLVHVAGEVLADPDTAQEIIDSVDGQVTAAAAELPGLEGQTFSLAQYVVGESIYIVADEDDGSSVFFRQLGMTLYPPVASEGERTGDARIGISTEQSDLLGADLVAFLVNGGDESDLADIPGFDQLPGTMAILDYPTIVGLNTPSPLSIPYSLQQLRPYLEEAG